MKSIKIVLFSLITLFLFASPFLNAADKLTGKDISVLMDKANSSTGTVTKGVLELKDLKSGSVEKRTYITISGLEQGLKRMLFKFIDSSYKGTAFLTVENKGGSKVQYVYLSSMGSPRQVEASDKESNFLDTDVTNEDLGGGNSGDYTYERLEDKTVDGMDCYHIERIPVNKKSKFSKYSVIIDKKSLLAVQVKAYSKDNRLVKTIKADEIKKVREGLYVPARLTVTNIPDKHETGIKILDVKEKAVNAGYFNKNRMGKTLEEEKL